MDKSTKLGCFRANRLFDYFEKVQDKRFKDIVYKSYEKLRTCVQKNLEEENAKRLTAGDLTYQYLEPKWLANSVHV